MRCVPQNWWEKLKCWLWVRGGLGLKDMAMGGVVGDVTVMDLGFG